MSPIVRIVSHVFYYILCPKEGNISLGFGKTLVFFLDCAIQNNGRSILLLLIEGIDVAIVSSYQWKEVLRIKVSMALRRRMRRI